jgi:predicted metal-dependent peptidase
MNDKTRGIGSTVLLGDSSVVANANDCPTAYTNGRDKFYGEAFCESLNMGQMIYLVLHENIHVLKMDIQRHLDLIEEDAQLANVAMDYVDNGLIESLNLGEMIERPTGALINPMFNGWSVREVYRYLKTGKDKEGKERGKPEPQGNDGDGNPTSVKIGGDVYSVKEMDKHEVENTKSMTPDEAKQLEKDIQIAVQQAVTLSRMRGVEMPLEIKQLLTPEVNWKQAMDEFTNTYMRGDDELTFRQYNRKHLADDYYMPSTYTERVGEILLCLDASGSTYGKVFEEFCGAFDAMLKTVRPERVRVLHWDTDVRYEQVLEESDYMSNDLLELLKPRGGGGTNVSAVSDYIIKRDIDADCCLVFTDGYVESSPRWNITIPTLWLVTQKEGFTPPTGRMVKINKGVK